MKKLDDSLADQIADIRSKFLPSAVSREVEHVQQEHDKKVERLQFRFSQTVDEAIKSAENSSKSRLTARDATKLNDVRMLKGMKLTASELAVICKNSNLTMDYFCCKVLRELAESNDICLEDLPDVHILPSLDEQLNTLDELRSECVEFLATYSSKHEHLSDLDLLKDNRLTAWETRFTNGLRSVKDISDDAKLRRSMSHIKSAPNELEKGRAIKAELAEVPDSLRARLLFEIAESRTISDVALSFSGNADEIEAFRNGGTKEYKEAVSAMEKVKTADTSLHAKEIAQGFKDNRYFRSELARESVNDSKLQDVKEFVDSLSDAETDG